MSHSNNTTKMKSKAASQAVLPRIGNAPSTNSSPNEMRKTQTNPFSSAQKEKVKQMRKKILKRGMAGKIATGSVFANITNPFNN